MLSLLVSLALADDPPPPPSDPPADDPPADETPAPPADAPPAPPPVDPRDADIFGPATPPTDPAAPAADPRDADIFGSGSATVPTETPAEPPANDLGFDFTPTTNDAIAAKIQARNDTLSYGGQYYQRLDLALPDETNAEDTRLAAPTLLDLFVDSRPNDRLRMYVRGRLDHDFTTNPALVDPIQAASAATAPVRPCSHSLGNRSCVMVDQLWTKFDIGRKVFVTLGQQRLKWGSGRFWNPTDFTAAQTLDPLQSVVFDTRTGVGLVKLQLPLTKANTDLYAVANFDRARSIDDVGGALRAEWVGGSTAIALSAAARKDNPLRLGADLSTGIWLLDFKLEGAVRHGDRRPYFEGSFDPAAFEFPTTVDRSDDWIPEVVAGIEFGAQYNDEDVLYLGVEGFFNDGGYANADLYTWLAVQGQFRPFYLGREYVGVYAMLPSPGQWDDASFTLSVLSNVSDETGVVRLDYSQSVLTFLRLAFNSSYALGEQGEFHYAVEIPEGTPGFEDGYSAPAPMLTFGASAIMTF